MALPDAEEIVRSLPPPGKLKKKSSMSEEEEGEEEEEYDVGRDSMSAFAQAIKGDDVDAMMSAWEDVKNNC